MKMEDHFKETLNKAVASEPPVQDAWSRFERRVRRGRWLRWTAGFAAAAAVAVASAIVVPHLGNRAIITPSTKQPTPSATYTVNDPYVGWQKYGDKSRQFALRYPPAWTTGGFEGYLDIQPPGVPASAKGDPTFFVSVAPLLPQRFDKGADASAVQTRFDGRRFVRSEVTEGGTHTVTYSIEWAADFGCMSDHGTDGYKPSPSTLRVTIRGETEALWNTYSQPGELIVDSIVRLVPISGREFRRGIIAPKIPLDDAATTLASFFDLRTGGATKDMLLRYVTADVKDTYEAIEYSAKGRSFPVDAAYDRYRIIGRTVSSSGVVFTVETKLAAPGSDVCRTDVEHYTVAAGMNAEGTQRTAVITSIGCSDPATCPSGLYRFREK